MPWNKQLHEYEEGEECIWIGDPAFLVLPYPSSILLPNNVTHWRKKAEEKKKLRAACKAIALKNPLPIWPNDYGRLHLKVTYNTPHLKCDLDNIHASFKAGIDGLADGWGVNDKMFRPYTINDLLNRNNPTVWIKALPDVFARQRNGNW